MELSNGQGMMQATVRVCRRSFVNPRSGARTVWCKVRRIDALTSTAHKILDSMLSNLLLYKGNEAQLNVCAIIQCVTARAAPVMLI